MVKPAASSTSAACLLRTPTLQYTATLQFWQLLSALGMVPVPPIDSLDMWPTLAEGKPSPRTAMALSKNAYIRWPHKIVTGNKGKGVRQCDLHDVNFPAVLKYRTRKASLLPLNLEMLFPCDSRFAAILRNLRAVTL